MRKDKPLLIIIGDVEWVKINDIIANDVGEVLNPFANVDFDFMAFDNTYVVSILVLFL